MSAARETVEGFAARHGLRVEYEGEIGFGRECVGLLDPDRDSWVAWSSGCGPIGAEDAYHKDDYLAVLGRGDEAETQLATWLADLEKRGVTFERREKDMPDLTTLAFGWTDELTAVRPA